MRTRIFTALVTAALLTAGAAVAQDARKETLVVANEFGPNMLDIHGGGATRPAYGVAWLAYDRSFRRAVLASRRPDRP